MKSSTTTVTATLIAATAACLLTAIPATPASAGARRMAFLNDVHTQPVGKVEYEQWVTWKTDKDDDASYNRFEFRHEFEFGLTDSLQFSIYAADWRHTQSNQGEDKTEFRTTSFELIKNLSDPVTDAIGSALYGEVKIGGEKFALEGKLLLQKDIGPWSFISNTVVEGEWEDAHYSEDKAEFKQLIGASYELTPQIFVGLEGLYEIEFDDFKNAGEDLFYVGPDFSYRTKDNLWFTVAALKQVSDIDSEPEYQVRLLLGFDF